MMPARLRRRLGWGVGGVALFLSAAVVAEVLPGRGPASEGKVPAAPLPVVAASAPNAPPIDDWVNTALQRPLFAQDRRPDAVAGPATHDTLPRLSGIIRIANTSLAIFQPEGGDGARPSVVVADGDEVSGWTITDIMNADVTLVRDGQIATVRLSYANRPPAQHRLGRGLVTVLHDKRTNAFLQP